MMERLLAGVLVLLVAGCSATTETSDPTLRIRISNARPGTLQCRMMFGHWVDRDLGTAEMDAGNGGGISVEVQQQAKDGALYVMRDDGERRMMLENIFCARDGDWQATVGQIDLAAVRTERPREVWVSCGLPEDGGRVACGKPKLWY